MKTLIEIISVYCSNFKNRKTNKAVLHLCRELQKDKEYARTWQSTIAMTIYDNTTHTHTTANKLADKLMQSLFGVIRNEGTNTQ